MAKRPKTGGRKKGQPNKVTADVRAAIALLAENNVARVEDWLTRGAKDDPLGAARTFAQLLEYHIPKLARSDIVVSGDFNVSIVDPTRRGAA